MLEDRYAHRMSGTIHQTAFSPSGGAARALEQSAGIHSRSSNFPKRVDPPPKVLTHDPGAMWRPETSFGATRFRLPHPTKGFVLNRQTLNADLNVTKPSFDTSKYIDFTYGKYHGMHLRKGITLPAPAVPRPVVHERATAPVSMRAVASTNAAAREQATVSRRNHQNAMSHSQVRIPSDYIPSDRFSIPYLREAQMTKDLYEVYQSLEEDETARSEGSLGPSIKEAQGPHTSTLTSSDGQDTGNEPLLTGSVIPALKLRQANDFRRSVIQLVEPVEVPIHTAFRLRTATAATDARLRKMYTTDQDTESVDVGVDVPSNPESRSSIRQWQTSRTKHRILTSNPQQSPFYWLPAKAKALRYGLGSA